MPSRRPATPRPATSSAKRTAAAATPKPKASTTKPPAGTVLFIGSEALPFSKTGGLADVLGSLPLALGRLGWDVTLVVPRYRGVAAGKIVGERSISVGGFTSEVRYYQVRLAERVRAILVDDPPLFDREFLYGPMGGEYSDNPRRFGVLVRAALEFVADRGVRPSVVHAHDWQGGLAPVYLSTLYARHPVLGGVPTVFTIHNLAYQGVFDADWLPRLDLPWHFLSLDEMEYWGRISLLKGGVNRATIITTVSPRYALEIQTPDGGAGFDGILRRRSADLVGILNGIDAEQWNPATDRHLPQPFDATDLSGKRAAKAAVLRVYGLADDRSALERPLIGLISRMIDQKGFDLIAAAGDALVGRDASFAVLGTGEPRYEDFWRETALRYPDRVGTRIGFDEGLAHLIEAGADMFLMPSQFEPCGLNQMYSLRYGTVPIVRNVGGLADTVRDPSRVKQGANGFVFDPYTAEALVETVERALATYRNQRKWRALQASGMKQDYSWDRSAREYVKIYERAGDIHGSGQRADLH
jgi:starch synthase